MISFDHRDCTEPKLALSPTFPYHVVPTADNWRNLILAVDDHLLFLQQAIRTGKWTERARARLRLYPRALRALHEVETAGGFHHA